MQRRKNNVQTYKKIIKRQANKAFFIIFFLDEVEIVILKSHNFDLIKEFI